MRRERWECAKRTHTAPSESVPFPVGVDVGSSFVATFVDSIQFQESPPFGRRRLHAIMELHAQVAYRTQSHQRYHRNGENSCFLYMF